MNRFFTFTRHLRQRNLRPALFLLFACIACSSPEAAAQANPPAQAVATDVSFSVVTESGEPADIDAAQTITYTDALILGIVEGLTEYLPVSSTGHLILTAHLLGLDSNAPLLTADGTPLMVQKDGEVQPFSLKHAVDAYIIIIQFGAILAVVILYWKRLVGILQGLMGRNPKGLLLLRNLILAFIPAAVIGLLLDDWIEAVLFGITPVLIALVAGAFLILIVEKIRKARLAKAPNLTNSDSYGPDLHELSPVQCVVIGLLQCVAMWPGTSRSMMTIVGGYLVGLNPVRAAEFSFLLGLITLSAASFYKVLQHGSEMAQTLPAGPVLFGLVAAGFSAAIAIRWFIHYLTRHGLGLFAWYRIALAIVCAWLLL